MSYYMDILKRANVHSITEFLLYGNDDLGGFTKTSEERLNQAHQECMNVIQKYDARGEDSELYDAVFKMTSENESVYMELGLRAGFLLAKDNLHTNNAQDNDAEKYKEMYLNLVNDISNAKECLEKAIEKTEDIYISE